MLTRTIYFSGLRASSLLLIVILTGVAIQATVLASPKDDRITAGQRLYREGRGVSGAAITAMVQGDVPLSGTQMTCQSCHGRSGMGTIESGRIPPGITGPLLFAPDKRTRDQRRRPAYTEKTLARAIRKGVDAAGKPLDPLMPRFQLGDRDVAALAAYLRQLGTVPSPGVGSDSLRLATLIAGDVDPAVVQAELDVIKAFVATRNRSGRQRLRGGHAPGDKREIFRKWSLDIWRLQGPPGSWRAQIATHYRKRPVFAMIGGLAAGSWQPVHEFCEARQMPCMLPDIDLPPADESGFYSFYFSRGLRLEAEIIASELKAKGLAGNVLSIVDGNDKNTPSVMAAAAFEQAITRRTGQVQTLDMRRDSVQELLAGNQSKLKSSAIVLWLNAAGLQKLAAKGMQSEVPAFLSSTLLDSHWDKIPATLRSRAMLVHLSALPDEPDPSLQRFRAWARVRHVSIRHVRHQALAYFACLAFAESTKHAGLYLSRDYVLDLLNHSSTLTAYLPLYTRAGITPGQRVLSRGGYLVDLAGGARPLWVVP